MAIYNDKLGEMVPDNLIADPTVKQIIQTGVISSGQGVLARGTVVDLSTGSSGTGKLVIHGTAAGSNETLTPYGVLTDDADATSADAVAEVYVTGKFHKSALIVKNSTTLSVADIQALRNGGIFVENVMD